MLSRELIRYFDDSRIDPLLLTRDLAALEAFLAGPGIDARDRSGRTVLMRAAAEFNHPVLAHLLSLGADPALVDDRARTALHHAAIAGDARAAELLLAARAPVDALDRENRTPLWHAAARHLPDSAIVDMLLRAGADPLRRDDRGVCPEDLL